MLHRSSSILRKEKANHYAVRRSSVSAREIDWREERLFRFHCRQIAEEDVERHRVDRPERVHRDQGERRDEEDQREDGRRQYQQVPADELHWPHPSRGAGSVDGAYEAFTSCHACANSGGNAKRPATSST